MIVCRFAVEVPHATADVRLRYDGAANLSVIANFPAGVAATISVPATAPRPSASHV